MYSLGPWELVVFALIAYVAVCFGLVARRYGRNPWLWGAVSVISPLNMIVLGYWAIVGRLPGQRA